MLVSLGTRLNFWQPCWLLTDFQLGLSMLKVGAQVET